MRISKNGVALIELFEGFSPRMYLDSVGLPTIGYGTLIDTAEEQYLKEAVISRSEAEELLIREMAGMERTLNLLLTNIPVNQNQYDALCSFVYNLGTGSLRTSTLLKKMKVNPNDPTIRNEFLKWVYAGGKKLKGLIDRRSREADLYFS
jgi:lysozyme